MHAIVLTTERLLLRELTEADASNLYDLDSDPAVMRFVGPRALPDVDAYRRRIAEIYLPIYANHSGLGVLAACDLTDGKFLGWFHLTPALGYRFSHEADFLDGDLDLGFRFQRRHWGRGLATEGGLALVESAFGLHGARRVVAVSLKSNHASIRVLEKCGLVCDREFVLPGYDDRALRFARHSAPP